MFLIETSILVDLLRGYPPARSWIDGLTPGEAAISVVTAAELIAGCRNQREQKLVEKELASYATFGTRRRLHSLPGAGIGNST